MKQTGLSQEALKLIACITMLIDHVGAVFFPQALWMRYVGRLAFPIYCFLLTEGAHYTKHPGKYALRLGIGMVLAEVPFDLLFCGGLTLAHQSVMVTLLLGYAMLYWMQKLKHLPLQVLLVIPFYFLANLLQTDYAGRGILLIAGMFLVRQWPWRPVLHAIGLAVLFARPAGGGLPWTAWAVLAAIPIALYTGQKRTASKWVQTGFYLFYPVHLAVLLALRLAIYFLK